MTTIVGVLLEVFEREAQQARVVISTIGKIPKDYKPKEGMRTLWELANHLAQIPLLDPSFYVGEIANVEQAQAKEKKLKSDDLKGLLATFDKGIKEVGKRFKGMTDGEFFAKTLKPFYEKRPKKNWAHYMPEFITHISMHKMQLWMYLKLAGAKVDMMTYYGVSPE
ncbi:MAG: DinB family protein [Promethearchaeota archaeon]